MSPAEKAETEKSEKRVTVGADLGSGFTLVETRLHHHEAYNADVHVNLLSAEDLPKLQDKVKSYGSDHPGLGVPPK
jgi:hypothetical protein